MKSSLLSQRNPNNVILLPADHGGVFESDLRGARPKDVWHHAGGSLLGLRATPDKTSGHISEAGVSLLSTEAPGTIRSASPRGARLPSLRCEMTQLMASPNLPPRLATDPMFGYRLG